jgi:D-serine deaminase-like pyridoxal phosphate-dependent protein
MEYDGHMQEKTPSPERDELVRAGSHALVDPAALIEAAGIFISIVSPGGTGTHNVSEEYPGITEIQAGSHLLMDTLYVNRGATFRRALTVLATVISTRMPGHAVIDCGIKSMSAEHGLPAVKDTPGIAVRALHAEHGLLELHANSQRPLATDQKIELWVHYSDATVNLHSALYGVRDGKVEEVFAIEH